MDEGRKRVLAIVAGILVARHLVLVVSPYLQRSVALLLLSGGILLSLYGAIPPAGLEWFPAFLYIKLLVSHLVREEPHARQSERSMSHCRPQF